MSNKDNTTDITDYVYFPRVGSFIDKISKKIGAERNIIITENENYMYTITYFGRLADELVNAVASFRGLDQYHQAAIALRSILERILPKENIIGCNVILASHPKADGPGLFLIFKEFAENTAEPDEAAQKFIDFLIKNVLREDYPETDEEEGNNKEIEGVFVAGGKRIKYYYEIDAVVKIETENFMIEGKMFNIPPEDPAKSLTRYLSKRKLTEYLIKRRCLYLLIGFSFLYDENVLKDKEIREFWGAYARSPRALEVNSPEKWVEYMNNTPVPVNPQRMGIEGSWIVHFTLIDAGIFGINIGTEKIVPENPKMVEKPSKIAEMILYTVYSHNKTVLEYIKEKYTKIKEKIPDVSGDIMLNICPNFNILKVHTMAGIIQDLRRELEKKEEIIRKEREIRRKIEVELLRERTEALKAEANALKAEANALKAEANALRERKERLKTEIRLARLEKDGKKQKKAEKELEKILSEMDRLKDRIEEKEKAAEELRKKANILQKKAELMEKSSASRASR